MYISINMINDTSQLADGAWFVPEFPAIKGLEIKWTDESNHSAPIFVKQEGRQPPVFYGVCDDDAVTSVAGVVAVLSEQEYQNALRAEKYKKPHRPTWVFDENSLAWIPPLPYPQDGNQYEWSEEMQAWLTAE